MSQVYWNVEGYGFEISSDMFDPELVMVIPALKHLNIEEARRQMAKGYDFFDIIEVDFFGYRDFIALIAKGTSLELGDTAGADYGQFLLLPFKSPWDYDEDEKHLTMDEVNNQIVAVLSPYLKKEYSPEYIKANSDYISYYGVA